MTKATREQIYTIQTYNIPGISGQNVRRANQVPEDSNMLKPTEQIPVFRRK